jgi:hypothetical protein
MPPECHLDHAYHSTPLTLDMHAPPQASSAKIFFGLQLDDKVYLIKKALVTRGFFRP